MALKGSAPFNEGLQLGTMEEMIFESGIDDWIESGECREKRCSLQMDGIEK